MTKVNYNLIYLDGQRITIRAIEPISLSDDSVSQIVGTITDIDKHDLTEEVIKSNITL
jgi:hypothetical protein